MVHSALDQASKGCANEPYRNTRSLAAAKARQAPRISMVKPAKPLAPLDVPVSVDRAVIVRPRLGDVVRVLKSKIKHYNRLHDESEDDVRTLYELIGELSGTMERCSSVVKNVIELQKTVTQLRKDLNAAEKRADDAEEKAEQLEFQILTQARVVAEVNRAASRRSNFLTGKVEELQRQMSSFCGDQTEELTPEEVRLAKKYVDSILAKDS